MVFTCRDDPAVAGRPHAPQTCAPLEAGPHHEAINFLNASPPLYDLICFSRKSADVLSGRVSLYASTKGTRFLVDL